MMKKLWKTNEIKTFEVGEVPLASIRQLVILLFRKYDTRFEVRVLAEGGIRVSSEKVLALNERAEIVNYVQAYFDFELTGGPEVTQ